MRFDTRLNQLPGIVHVASKPGTQRTSLGGLKPRGVTGEDMKKIVEQYIISSTCIHPITATRYEGEKNFSVASGNNIPRCALENYRLGKGLNPCHSCDDCK